MNHKQIKFNFYSKLMNQTITVFGAMESNWHGGAENFKVKKIINNNRQEIIKADVHEEATNHYNYNKENIAVLIID